MKPLSHRTKIVVTIGPASNSPEVLREAIAAGMNVARLNFSHGSYEEHARVVSLLRSLSEELGVPTTLLQDLQGPKIRAGQLPDGGIALKAGDEILLVPQSEYNGRPMTASIDYPHLAEEATAGMQILLDDGLLEFEVMAVEDLAVRCMVVQGGLLKSRKGVNLPNLDVRLPSMTEKDKQDLKFGVEQDVDIVSLSFVRRRSDILELKELLAQHGRPDMPVLAKIEKPQAIENLESILDTCDAVMVARGDLGVEMRPEKVPVLQKHIIKRCNLKAIPVITATQMLDSMIRNPRPTRAEANDVANAIVDGTDAVMLSGESAVGDFPVQSVQMLARIAEEMEPTLEFVNHPPARSDSLHALTESVNTIDRILDLRCIVAFTMTGLSAVVAAAERPDAPVVAFTPDVRVYRRLNLIWGVKPMLLEHPASDLEHLIGQMEGMLRERGLADTGDNVLVLAASPLQHANGTNMLKIHTVR
ncbi:pyruvate kinase [Rubidibacter lacunae KORDI 51-2]|uniref:Pyruvate kinase n=1 Tax=Rubidibacter lacunae KORDI 51-2 TaxID=582515 RepID=U5DN08_9CHRO|nr:pyruvate kinase [Rubidibacter lacunae]ERN43051.1 pyruvate kinase [Rubidibacter lacunae KORDI 51-2]